MPGGCVAVIGPPLLPAIEIHVSVGLNIGRHRAAFWASRTNAKCHSRSWWQTASSMKPKGSCQKVAKYGGGYCGNSWGS